MSGDKNQKGGTSAQKSEKCSPRLEEESEDLFGFAGNDRFSRALFRTRSTVGAQICIDYVLVFSLTDRSNGALILAGTTSQTIVGNYIRHNFYLLLKCCFLLFHDPST
jgi:hypothetical protein